MADNFSLIGNTANGYIMGNPDNLSILGDIGGSSISGDALSSAGSGSGFSLGSLPWGQITNVLGKLGAGAMTGASVYQNQKNMADYVPYTQWLGNGLAKTGYINNRANKQNQLDQLFGAGQMLGNLRGNFFGLFDKNGNSSSDLNTNLNNYQQSTIGSTIDDYVNNRGSFDYLNNNNYGIFGNATNDYLGGLNLNNYSF